MKFLKSKLLFAVSVMTLVFLSTISTQALTLNFSKNIPRAVEARYHVITKHGSSSSMFYGTCVSTSYTSYAEVYNVHNWWRSKSQYGYGETYLTAVKIRTYMKVGSSWDYQEETVWGPGFKKVPFKYTGTADFNPYLKVYGRGTVKVMVETISVYQYLYYGDWVYASSSVNTGWITCGYVGVYLTTNNS